MACSHHFANTNTARRLSTAVDRPLVCGIFDSLTTLLDIAYRVVACSRHFATTNMARRLSTALSKIISSIHCDN
jgi:hypothetical protein